MATAHAMDAEKVMETYFLETRAKLLEIAANLDRLDRAGSIAADDSRLVFIHNALKILQGPSQVDGQCGENSAVVFEAVTAGWLDSTAGEGFR